MITLNLPTLHEWAMAWQLVCVVGMTWVFFICWANGGRAGFSIIEYGEQHIELLLFSVLTPITIYSNYKGLMEK